LLKLIKLSKRDYDTSKKDNIRRNNREDKGATGRTDSEGGEDNNNSPSLDDLEKKKREEATRIIKQRLKIIIRCHDTNC